MRSPFPASNEIPAKQIASKHPTPSLSSGPLPDTPPRRPRQFAASNPSPPAIPDNSPPKRLQAAPETRTSSHKPLSRPPSVRQSSECPAVFRVPSSLPSAQQSSEHRAILRTRPLLSPPNARPHRRSDTPAPPKSRTPPGIPKSPNSSRYPYTPIPSPGIPKHKKRSRHCAGSAPNYLQVSTRSYLSRSESGSGSCSSPYC